MLDISEAELVREAEHLALYVRFLERRVRALETQLAQTRPAEGEADDDAEQPV